MTTLAGPSVLLGGLSTRLRRFTSRCPASHGSLELFCEGKSRTHDTQGHRRSFPNTPLSSGVRPGLRFVSDKASRATPTPPTHHLMKVVSKLRRRILPKTKAQNEHSAPENRRRPPDTTCPRILIAAFYLGSSGKVLVGLRHSDREVLQQSW